MFRFLLVSNYHYSNMYFRYSSAVPYVLFGNVHETSCYCQTWYNNFIPFDDLLLTASAISDYIVLRVQPRTTIIT